MEHRETLLSFAEIAVALAGFTGLVGVLGKRESGDSREIGWIRLRTMLEVALRNAALALLPIPFLGMTSSETVVWRIASGVYLVTVLALLLFRRRQARLATLGQALSGRFLSLLPLSLLACVANILGMGGPHAFALYFLSLLLGLITAGMLFVSAAASFFDDQQG